MIKHLVLMKFKTDISEEKFSQLEKMLSAIPSQISEVKGYHFGLDVVRSQRSYDFGLAADFDDLQSLECYQNHPKHQKVVSLLKEICEDMKAVDFTL
jgi:antibiotic biosynthesis monooxygenase (ABM) superfamily enzyme